MGSPGTTLYWTITDSLDEDENLQNVSKCMYGVCILKFSFLVKIVILRSVTSQGCQIPVTP